MKEPLFDSLDVYEEEWKTIDQRPHRKVLGAWRPPLKSPQGLIGLALSGGGIRSATFNLGVLQAFRRANVLTLFDYLSTVSGGGFIGGWWSAWLARGVRNSPDAFPAREAIETWRHDTHGEPPRCRSCHREPVQLGGDGFCSAVCRAAGPQPTSPDPVHHVRLFSNYLTPRKGAMSRDLWRAVTVISRNLVLTWLVLISMLAIPIVLALFAWNYASPTGMPLFSATPHTFSELLPRITTVAKIPLAFVAWFAFLSVAWLMIQRGAVAKQWFIALIGLSASAWLFFRALPPGNLSRAAVVTFIVIAIAAARTWLPWSWDRDIHLNRVSRLQGFTIVAAGLAASVIAVAAFGHEVVNYVFFGQHVGFEKLAVNTGKYLTLATTAVAAIHAAIAGAPAGGAESVKAPSSKISKSLLALAPPLVLVTLVLAISWLGAQAVVQITDPDKWTTVLRDITLVGVIAMAAFAYTEERRWLTPIAVPAALLAFGAIVVLGRFDGRTAAALGALAAASAALVIVGAKAFGGIRTVSRSEWLIAAGAAISMAVIAIELAIMAPPRDVRLLLSICGALASVVILLGWTTDPNSLSLHTFYKVRLVRAYLGASNSARTGHDAEDVTETKVDDDVPLGNISDPAANAPYHLINATLDLTAGSDLVIAQRAAAPFLFSRHFCGSARTGYRRTSTYRSGTITLGTAVAISGAAASPVMGSQTPSTALSMLMALLNVRLGYWIPTPNREDWRAPQARFWPFYLLREFLSNTADTGRYCYVTDGGHFDNTGVYPLIERACRLIVLTDCGADPNCVFDDLARLVRRCRIDFGAIITFPSLEPFSRATLADDRRNYVVGRIDYRPSHVKALGWSDRDVNDFKPQGTLIVVKPTLVAKLETDVSRYSQMYESFPQQSTADQWFDEAQFESYRRLGEISGDAAAEEIARQIVASSPRGSEAEV